MKRLTLLDHLPKKLVVSGSDCVEGGPPGVHSSTIRLGSMLRSGTIHDDDARVAALLEMLVDVTKDYTTPQGTSLSRDLDKYIRSQVQFLVECRQLSIGMGSLIKSFRHAMSRLNPNVADEVNKKILVEKLGSFGTYKLTHARSSIVAYIKDSISHGDTVLTFGGACVVTEALLAAAETITFKCIVVDCRPLNTGLAALNKLSKVLECIYTPLAGVSSVLPTANKVLLGASGVLSNGAVLAPAWLTAKGWMCWWPRSPSSFQTEFTLTLSCTTKWEVSTKLFVLSHHL